MRMLSRVKLGQTDTLARIRHQQHINEHDDVHVCAYELVSAYLRSAKRICFVALPVSRHRVLNRMRPGRELQSATR